MSASKGPDNRQLLATALFSPSQPSFSELSSTLESRRPALYAEKDPSTFMELLGRQCDGFTMALVKAPETENTFKKAALANAVYNRFAFYLLERRNDLPQLAEFMVKTQLKGELQKQNIEGYPSYYTIPTTMVQKYKTVSDATLKAVNQILEGDMSERARALRASIETNFETHHPGTKSPKPDSQVFANHFMHKVHQRFNNVVNTILEHRDAWIGTSKGTQTELDVQQDYAHVLAAITRGLLLPAYKALGIQTDIQIHQGIQDWHRSEKQPVQKAQGNGDQQAEMDHKHTGHYTKTPPKLPEKSMQAAVLDRRSNGAPHRG